MSYLNDALCFITGFGVGLLVATRLLKNAMNTTLRQVESTNQKITVLQGQLDARLKAQREFLFRQTDQ